MPLSNPTTPERDLLAVTYDKVKEIRVVDTDDQSKVLAIENLAIAGTKVTVGRGWPFWHRWTGLLRTC